MILSDKAIKRKVQKDSEEWAESVKEATARGDFDIPPEDEEVLRRTARDIDLKSRDVYLDIHFFETGD